MEGATSWGQLALYIAGALALGSFAVGQTFRTLTSVYSKLLDAQQAHIVGLQAQNAGQQTQIDQLRQQVEAVRSEHADCRKAISDLQSKVNGGPKS